MGVVEEKKQIDEQIDENTNQPNVEELVEKIDYKMVTFSLAGKDYGIDIMKVKEISKARDFTYVPNTSAFVRGVYNLRGDIISVIDLRMMFNLINEKSKDGSVENMIILRVEDHVIGIIVDSINKVVGIPSSRIQPPHPLFGDINIKYIKGVVENDEKLYIILDVDRIFTEDEEEVVFSEESDDEELSSLESIEEEKGSGLNFNFITETLATFKSFYVTRFNDTWVSSRFGEWTKIKGDNPEDIQLKSAEEADEYLSTFYSSGTGTFLTGEYLKDLKSLLSKLNSSNISMWNPGCGKGFEAYSLACTVKTLFPESRLKVWANDNDLLSISMAPNLVFSTADLPEDFNSFCVQGKNGYQFNDVIKTSVLFEYHDVLNQNPFPNVDVIFARDLISFLKPEEQAKLFQEFKSKLVPGGLLILGQNETIIDNTGWNLIESGSLVAFKKEND